MSLNFAIDPYGVTTFSIPGINDLKPDKPEHERLFKTIDIIRIKPLTVFLGNSRVNKALDPTHPALVGSYPAYNFALNGADIYEVKQNLQHALANQPKLRKVIIGIDLYMFNTGGITENNDVSSFGKTSLALEDLLKVTFSMDAFTASLKTIVSNTKVHFTDQSYLNGMNILREAGSPNRLLQFKNKLREYLTLHRDFNISQERLNALQDIVNICKQNNIQLKVFVNPLHATHWETVRLSGNWSKFEQWKREVVKITPFWDFSGYNTITTEQINDQMKNYFESSHYKKVVGNLILNRVLGYQEDRVPPDFGTLITPVNIESHLQKIQADWENWSNNNPDMVKLVQYENLHRR
jgi:hypothetical protein